MDHLLEKFVSVVEHGSFTKAAQHTHTSQPALSSAIKILESRYKHKLIARNTRPLTLTAAGQIVYDTANRMKLDISSLTNQLVQLNKQTTLNISIGAIDSVASQLFSTDTPIDHVSVHVDNSKRLITAVEKGSLDMALVTEPTMMPESTAQIRSLGSERLVLVTHPTLAVIVKENIKRHQRINNFITYNPQSTTYQYIASESSSRGISLDIILTSTSPDLIKQLVCQQKGTALLPSALISEQLRSGELVEITGFDVLRPIGLVWNSNKPLTARHYEILQSIDKKLKLQ